MSMTKLELREHYAGLAMAAIINDTLAWSDGLNDGSAHPEQERTAREAVRYADALIAELDNKPL